MYLYVFGGFILVTVIGLFYLLTRFRRFRTVRRLSGGRKWASWLIAAVPVLVMAGFIRMDPVNVIIAIVHLLVFWVICEIAGRLIRRRLCKKADRFDTGKSAGMRSGRGSASIAGSEGIYWEGLAALLITGIYLGCGCYLAYHVTETDYHLTTDKDLGAESLRIVQITDSHVGTTFDGEGFARHMEKVQQTSPDAVVITGDYVDDDTTRKDMVRSCEALGNLKTTYGVYYVFGNHDKGYGNYRDFTTDDLREEFKKNGVKVLEDESVLVNDLFYIVGRQDRSVRNRASVQDLLKDLDASRYIVVLDHQPQEFEQEESAGADLVLCGHTHGGQMFPVGILGEVSGANQKTYGLETRGNTNIIVSSGISDWAIKFKTFTVSEFTVIDVTPGSVRSISDR